MKIQLKFRSRKQTPLKKKYGLKSLHLFVRSVHRPKYLHLFARSHKWTKNVMNRNKRLQGFRTLFRLSWTANLTWPVPEMAFGSIIPLANHASFVVQTTADQLPRPARTRTNSITHPIPKFPEFIYEWMDKWNNGQGQVGSGWYDILSKQTEAAL